MGFGTLSCIIFNNLVVCFELFVVNKKHDVFVIIDWIFYMYNDFYCGSSFFVIVVYLISVIYVNNAIDNIVYDCAYC